MERAGTYSVHRPESSELILKEGELLYSATSVYAVSKFIGEGCFGTVVECQNVDTHEKVAIKVIKHPGQDTEQELYMLNEISILDPDLNNLVRFLESFTANGHTCLVFEQLDQTLFDLVARQGFRPVGVEAIRDVAEQLLVALDGLQDVGVLHTDIKPDNIMVVRAGETPMRIKMVDFGLAILAHQVPPGMEMQPFGYRAPEVCFGLPITEAVDVWGVGCVLAFLFLGNNIFPVHCEYQMVKSIIQTLGQPPDHQLDEGGYTDYFFIEDKVDDDGPKWRLRTPYEYSAVNKFPEKGPKKSNRFPGGLDDLLQIHSVQNQAELEDRAALVDLLKGLLHVDREQRLTPRAALQHPFITRSYRDQGPRPGPSQDPLSRPTLDPLIGSPMDLFRRMDPSDGQDPLDKSPEDPVSGLVPLDESPEDPLSGLGPLGGSTEHPLSAMDHLSMLGPLGGSTEHPLSTMDPLSGLGPLGGSTEHPLSTMDPLSGLGPDGGSTEHPLSTMDPLSGLGGDSQALNSGPAPGKRSGGGFKRMKKRIRGALNRFRDNFFSCFRPRTDSF